MLDKLPIEVFTEITNYLSTKEKVKCMTICSSWNDIIKNTTLVQDISITDDSNFKSLIQLIHTKKLPGSQVRILTAQNLLAGAQFFRQLPFYFPNLTELSWPMPLASSNQLPLSGTEKANFKSWRFSLEKLECYITYSFFPEILQLSRFEKLTELYFHFRQEDHSTLTIGQLASSLKAAPALRILKVDIRRLSIADIELLHENTPVLESLELEDTEFSEDLGLPSTIVPIYQFKSLHITSQCILNGGETWMTYFSQKYKRLERFIVECALGNAPMFGNILLLPQPNISSTINQSLIELLHAFGPQLKSFRISRSPLNKDILKVMDDIGLQLEELHLGDIRNKLDLMNAFEESNQWKAVESLFVSNHPLLKMTKKNYKIKKLSIRNLFSKDNKLYLDNILEQYPNLKELNASCSRIQIVSGSHGVFPLRRLRLSVQVLDDSLFEYLSRYTPMLYSVSVNCTLSFIEDEKVVLNLQLPEHRLQYFSFNTYLKEFDVKVITENTIKYYRVTENDSTSAIKRLEDESTLNTDRLVVIACRNATYLRVKHFNLY